jgi:hypothetical protein
MPKLQRHTGRPSLRELLEGEREYMLEGTYTACVSYGYTMKEIAKPVGLPYATVSRMITQVKRYSKEDEM